MSYIVIFKFVHKSIQRATKYIIIHALILNPHKYGNSLAIPLILKVLLSDKNQL